MPEHVHLILNEPEGGILAKMIQVLKQQTARRIGFVGPHFWQRRYYDFNIRSESKLAEKLRYTHRNPVTRGLVDNPEEWAWSSFRHYALGEEGVVKIESKWVERWGVRTPTRQDEYC